MFDDKLTIFGPKHLNFVAFSMSLVGVMGTLISYCVL